MTLVPASRLARRRLSVAARRLGTSDPVDAIGGLLDRSFELPADDPRYLRNALAPGSMPIEHSFSELSTGTLRLDMEPLGPLATAASRRQEVSREMRRLVQQHYGRQALAWFDERSEPWRTGRVDGAARFGAWFGAGFDEGGLQEAKVYYELPDGAVDDLPPNLQHAARVATACLPRLQPIFTSIAAGRTQGAQRLYFFHRGDLRLLDLEPLMNRLGIGHQLPSLLTAVGLILGGRFTLPEGSVVLALRETPRGMEMKLEILLPAIPDPPREMHGLIDWIQAMSLDEGAQTCGAISVVSVRLTPHTGARLSLYFRPTGYDRAPSRPRTASDDPYTVALS